MDAACAAEPAALPDPRTVTTVADLAEQLHRLRLAAARPAPTDNPLTLRELAVLTGLPHSTLGNAESGRILPRVEVVYRFAQACGVPADQLSWWARARNEVAVHRRRCVPQAPVHPVVRSVARRGDEAVTPEQLLQELAGVDIEQAAERLSRLHPGPVADFLRRLHPGFVARLLAAMDPVLAAGHLSGLPPQDAVTCLNEMDALAAARLLTLQPVPDAVTHLALMRPAAAVPLLLAMPPAALGQRLAHLSADLVRRTVGGMSPHQRRDLLAGPPLPDALTVELLFSLGWQESVTFLSTAATRTAARALTMLPADPAAGLLTALPPSRAATLLAAMPPEQAADRLMEMTGEQAAALLGPLPLRTVGAVLSHLRVPNVARLLAWLPAERRLPVLRNIRAERSVEIRWHMETMTYKEWCRTRPAHPGTNRATSPTLAELG